MNKKLNIRISNNIATIYFKDLTKRIIVSKFIYIMYGFLKRGVTQIVLDFKKCSTASYPNIVTPLSGIINYYIEVHKFDFSFKLRHNCYLSTTFFEKPIKLANNIAEVENNILIRLLNLQTLKMHP
ncbi:MAG: hypothetical protein WC006_02705 [Bacilli bacterium]|nr:hypothetical protein [Bacilli bacterium]